jgi:branched-chain amino acid aminotransferase
VAETSAGTLFVLLNGTWVTPPVSEGTLPGNRRVGRDGGRTGREAVVTLDDLRTV